MPRMLRAPTLFVALVVTACGGARSPAPREDDILKPTPSATLTGGAGETEVDASPPSRTPSLLTSDQVQQVFASHQADIRARCAETAPALAPVSETVTASIGAGGVVASAVAEGDAPATGACLEAEVRGWRFPETGAVTTVRLPFHFVGGRAP